MFPTRLCRNWPCVWRIGRLRVRRRERLVMCCERRSSTWRIESSFDSQVDPGRALAVLPARAGLAWMLPADGD